MIPDDFTLMDECKLMGYGESDTSGHWIKLQVKDLDRFRGLKGETFEVTLRLIGSDGSLPDTDPAVAEIGQVVSKSDKPYGQEARLLWLSPAMRAPNLWRLLGKPQTHEEWVRHQPCLICKQTKEVQIDGTPANVFAHVLSAAAMPSRADMKERKTRKPPYRGVPMCNSCHTLQHDKGIVEVYKLANGEPPPGRAIADKVAQEWLEQQALRFTKEWVFAVLREICHAESIADVNPVVLRQVFKDTGFEHPEMLPESYNWEAVKKGTAHLEE